MTTLADLRRESLAEQKADALEPEPVSSPDDAHLLECASAQMLTQASPQARTGASEAAVKQVRNRVSKSASADVSKDVSELSLEEIVRAALGQKRQHPGGTKASVDMSPELSLRIKRYGLDHGGITSRQLFVELATAFLDREGY